MKSIRTFLLTATAGILLCGCSTTATFNLPPDTQIRLGGREAVYGAGTIETRPYFWTSSAGVPFQLIKAGHVVESGKVKSHFRVVSIFWPPYGLIYWPMGFGQSCYDLNRAPPYKCAGE
ncbi:MAG: hypothetical protein ACRETM_10050 [Stenotrophobium sp.]